jgi:hypothetical protein
MTHELVQALTLALSRALAVGDRMGGRKVKPQQNSTPRHLGSLRAIAPFGSEAG